MAPISTPGSTDANSAAIYPERMDDRSGLLRSAWLPALIAAAGAAELASLSIPNWQRGIALEVAACAVLVARYRLPLLAPVAAMAVLLLIPWFGVPLDKPAVPIAVWALSFFSLGRHVRGVLALTGFGLVLVQVYVDYQWVDTRDHDLSDVAFVMILATPPFVLGRVVHRVDEQKRALQEAQEQIRLAAVRDERERIARELHDVIAHSVSAMVVQTAAAQDLVRSDPDRAEEVLAGVASTGRRALAETGRMLHLIRDTGDEFGLSPTPGISDVPALVDTFRAGGLAVDLTLDEPDEPLPAAIDVSAYRVVQEALTNALRYASDAAATVTIASTQGRLSIRAANRANGTVAGGSGLGLVGMGERISLLGGTLTHGLTATGAFELEATIPVDR